MIAVERVRRMRRAGDHGWSPRACAEQGLRSAMDAGPYWRECSLHSRHYAPRIRANLSSASHRLATMSLSPTGSYVGRFAPTPSGDLHLGSLYAAVASFLDARAHGGRWLLRIEDLDRPREVAGSADGILRTLQAFGFEWDGEVVRQRDRSELYVHALQNLRARNLTFECTCSRMQL